MSRTITLTVDQARFFDEVSKFGLINSTCPIGSRVIACLLGGVDWREAMGLAVYGVQVFEEPDAPVDPQAGTARQNGTNPGRHTVPSIQTEQVKL